MTLTLPKTDLDHFAEAYLECALWSSHDETDSGEEVRFDDYSSDDIAPETLAEMVADCARFLRENESLISEETCLKYGPDCGSPVARAGHDFWLTRNDHGAGFWDGDWAEPAATALDESSKRFGEYDLYLGDDGRIYGSKG